VAAQAEFIGYTWFLSLDGDDDGGALERSSQNGFDLGLGKWAGHAAGRHLFKEVRGDERSVFGGGWVIRKDDRFWQVRKMAHWEALLEIGDERRKVAKNPVHR
jgi:hypothetical protein